MSPFILLLFRVGLVAVGWFAAESAPVLPSSLDVELVDIVAVDGDEIVQSSMITPFPSGNGVGGLLPDEPNFFWSGSGDDPDAGMTYWITTTIYKTAVVTMTPSTPKPTIATTSPSITPTPPMKEASSPPITWPVEAFQPRNWIRTIIRSDMNETSPRFHQLIQSRLGRMYSDLLQQRNVTNVIGIGVPLAHVIIHNITRRSGDIDVIYSLSTWHHQIPMDGSITSRLVEPYLAVAAVRRVDVTRQLCHRPANDTQEVSLCLSVVNQAEPFSRAEETSVATRAGTGYQYWIVGIVVGVLLIVIVIVVFIYLNGRKRDTKRNNKRDVAVGESSPHVLQSEPVRDSRSKAARISKNIVSKLVAKDSTEVEEDPDPWVRKARSTSKKQLKHKLRPQTAPERNAHRQSSSSLSAILSGSTSSTSSSLDRMEYRLSREEPIQPSRGTRRLKRKRTVKADVLSPERAKAKEKLKTTDTSILKTSRRIMTSVEMETQEVVADFSDYPDTPDDVSHEVELILTTDDLGWQPGSLIPSCVTAGVFGSRKISSAPVVLESAGHAEEDGRHFMRPKRAWSTPDHVQLNGQSKNVENVIVPVHYESSNIVSSDDHSIPGRQQATHLKHPALHIHSISYPTWPSLSDTDPAIELIRTIKDELKKFDPKVS
ncbi:uncharacterized protein LOC130689038 [Daphnia carinata]|uniref:uncharacterized protein LOC130689038 n=1 Tax=Daphnia carinata TaxID=120202 RepID=UPI00257D0891|nr:uncharacterized protein LOC130689038 [Daphnia carinata]